MEFKKRSNIMSVSYSVMMVGKNSGKFKFKILIVLNLIKFIV